MGWRNKIVDSPCYQCTRRELGCHSKCEDYKKIDERNKLKRRLIREAKNKEKDFYGVRKHKFEKI